MTHDISSPLPDSHFERMTQSQLDALVSLHERFLQGRIGGRRAILKRIDLSALTLKGRRLRQADFTSCLMKSMDLSNADFQEASLYACDLSYSNLNDAVFVRADLRGARIEGADLIGTNLERADLRSGGMSTTSSFDQVQEPSVVNFRGANLSGARLSGVMASHADFSDAIMAKVDIQNADLRNASFRGADLSDALVVGAQLSGAQMQKTILTGVSLDRVKDRVDVQDAITDANVGHSIQSLAEPLPKMIEQHRMWVETAGASGRQLDLSGYDLRELETLKRESLTAIRAAHAKWMGLNLYQIQLQSAVLDGSDFRTCDMEGADLRASSFRGAIFNHANMKGVNMSPLLFGSGTTGRFAPCDCSGVQMRYANLSVGNFKNVDFRGADLSHADLRNADLREADLSGANLTGALMDGANTEGARLPDSMKGRAFSIKDLSDTEGE